MAAPADFPPRLAEGNTAEVFAWHEHTILKLFRPGYKRGSIEREATVARAAHALGLPTPAVEQVLDFQDRTGIVYERVEGDTLLHLLDKEPWRLTQVAWRLADLHAAMHATDASQASLPLLTTRLAQKISNAKGLTPQQQQAIQQVLASLPRGTRLCHGDFHPDNVLVHKAKHTIIDWQDGTCGHPLADVARTVLLLHRSALPDHTVGLRLFGILRGWFCYSYLKCYRHHHPCPSSEMRKWLLVNAAARLAEDVPEHHALQRFVAGQLARL